MNLKSDIGRAFQALKEVMDRLRGENGCPWDRAQTMYSLRTYILEEAYEVVDAINHRSPNKIREELGDLLLQVFFLGRIFEEQDLFHVGDIAETLREKLIARHPHVFGEDKAETAEEVLSKWEHRKMKERGLNTISERLRDIPGSFPALAEAFVIQRRVASVGFDWDDIQPVYEKIQEELQEVVRAQSDEEREKEVGDLLFAVVNLARKLGIHPEIALKRANAQFIERFEKIEEELHNMGKLPELVDLETMDELWNMIKKREQRE